MSPARARTRTARSRVERTGHEATVPPQNIKSDGEFPSFQEVLLLIQASFWFLEDEELILTAIRNLSDSETGKSFSTFKLLHGLWKSAFVPRYHLASFSFIIQIFKRPH